ncbi:MAG TPA: hypothetical protein VFP12_01105 [Allosphingosinicella sp.]|nr:hypothetical protein [Allosphingosinicella sp.]
MAETAPTGVRTTETETAPAIDRPALRIESAAGRTKLTLTWIVELLTIFGLIGFLGSILLNSYVFSFWNLSFLQVATLSDVVMSGIQLSLDIATLSAAAVLGFLLGRLLFVIVPDPESGVGSLLNIMLHVVEFIRMGIGAILVLGSPLLMVYAVVVGLENLLILHGLAGALGFLLGNINTEQLWKGSPVDKVLATISLIAVVGLFSYSYVQVFLSKDSVIGGGVADGFLSKRHGFTLLSEAPDCARARVLWLGERSIVARCERTGSILLLENGENNLIL